MSVMSKLVLGRGSGQGPALYSETPGDSPHYSASIRSALWLHDLSSSLKCFALILRKRCSLKYMFVALTKRVIAASNKYSEKQIKYPIG